MCLLYGGNGSWVSVFCFLLFKIFIMEKSIDRLHKEERLGYRDWIGSRYYDHPDGEDLFGKLSFTTKAAFFASSIFGLVYANVPPIPKSIAGKLVRVAQFVVPAVGMAATFTCVTYYATNFRKKDDQINYILGGAAAGLILAPVVGQKNMLFWGPFYFSLAGFAKKSVEMEGTKLVPPFKRTEFSSFYRRKLDTSLVEDTVGGSWTKEPPK